MAVTLDMKWWKKTKPLTLAGETVTEAMKQVDAATEALFKAPTRESLAKLSGALKLLQGALTQTKAKCNKTLHSGCIKALTEAEPKAVKAYKAVQVMQAHFAQELQSYQAQRTKVATDLGQLSTSKDIAKVAAALKDLEAFLVYLNNGLKNGEFSSQEMERGMKYMAAAMVLLKDMEKNKATPSDPSKKGAWQKQMDGSFVELGETAKKIGTLGGYNEMPRAVQSYKIEM